jgi:hypothetical protein
MSRALLYIFLFKISLIYSQTIDSLSLLDSVKNDSIKQISRDHFGRVLSDTVQAKINFVEQLEKQAQK